MRTVELGNSGIEASAIGYGTYHLTDKLSPPRAVQSLGAAFDAGVTLFDTSDNYGTEVYIGKAVDMGLLPRDQITVATKTGLKTSYEDVTAWEKGRSSDTSPERLAVQVEGSLDMLGSAGPIDLYQLHTHDVRTEPQAVAEAMQGFIESGKIRAYGVSNYSRNELEALLNACDDHDLRRPDTSQPFYNMLSAFGMDDSVHLAQDEGLTVLAHSPLYKGLLTDRSIDQLVPAVEKVRGREGYDSQTDPLESRFQAIDSLGELQEYARSHNKTTAQLAIAWLAMQPSTVVVTSSTKPEYVATATEALEWQIDQDGLDAIAGVRRSIDKATAGELLSIAADSRPYYSR